MKRAFGRILLGCSVLSFLLVSSCGQQNATRSSNLSDGGKNSRYASLTPPKEYYDQLLRQKLLKMDQSQAGLSLMGGSSPKIWINFEGASIKKGAYDPSSFIICVPQVDLPPAITPLVDQQAIIDMINQIFKGAGIDVELFLDKPLSGTYMAIHVVGDSSDALGCNSNKATVVAMLDKGNLNASDVSFVFVDNIADNPAKLIETAHAIMHAIGLGFGLDQTDKPGSVMYPYPIVDGKIKLKDISASAIVLLKQILARSSADGLPGRKVTGLDNLPPELANLLPGLDQIAAIASQLAQLKPDQLVNIASLQAALAQLLPNGVQVPSLEKIITIIELARLAAAHQQQANGVDLSGMSEADIMKIVAIVLTPENLAKVGGIIALASMGGASTVAAAIAAIQLILDIAGQIEQENHSATPSPSRIPDLSALLGLNNITDMKTLFAMLDGHVQVVNLNFTGEVRDALLSLLKVAYAQAYKNLGTN